MAHSSGDAGPALLLPLGVAEELLAHAQSELPNEACGLLAGSLSTGRVKRYHAARNLEASAYLYQVHPDDLVRIVLAIDDADEDLLAIFHSHTHTPAVPSATDLRNAHYPDAFYLLATLADPDASPADALRAWRIRSGVSEEVGLRIE